MPPPNAFLGGPPVFHPPATKPSFYEVVNQASPRAPSQQKPEPENKPEGAPLLSVSYTDHGNFCTISKWLLAALPQLKAGRRVAIVVPFKRGGEWYLDTRPKTGVGVEMPKSARPSTYFRIPPIAKVHFMRSGQAVGQERAGRGPNIFVPLLRFILGPEVPGEPGHYRLIRQA